MPFWCQSSHHCLLSRKRYLTYKLNLYSPFCLVEGPAICQQPMTVGTGDANLPRYYYDQTTRQCKQFFYKGRTGNQNNFLTLQDCEQTCPSKFSTLPRFTKLTNLHSLSNTKKILTNFNLHFSICKRLSLRHSTTGQRRSTNPLHVRN